MGRQPPRLGRGEALAADEEGLVRAQPPLGQPRPEPGRSLVLQEKDGHVEVLGQGRAGPSSHVAHDLGAGPGARTARRHSRLRPGPGTGPPLARPVHYITRGAGARRGLEPGPDQGAHELPDQPELLRVAGEHPGPPLVHRDGDVKGPDAVPPAGRHEQALARSQHEPVGGGVPVGRELLEVGLGHRHPAHEIEERAVHVRVQVGPVGLREDHELLPPLQLDEEVVEEVEMERVTQSWSPNQRLTSFR